MLVTMSDTVFWLSGNKENFNQTKIETYQQMLNKRTFTSINFRFPILRKDFVL